MNNYIVTAMNEKFWPEFGATWIYTLRKYALYNGEIIVVNHGLGADSVRILKNMDVNLINSRNNNVEDIRMNTFLEISNISKKNKGNYFYWDSDVYFKKPIEEILFLVENKFLITENHNCGFLAAPYYQWAFIEDIQNFYNLSSLKINSKLIFQTLITKFKNIVKEIDNKWNFIDVLNLNRKEVKIIHPSEGVKNVIKGKNIFFHEEKKEEYLNFLSQNKSKNIFVKSKK